MTAVCLYRNEGGRRPAARRVKLTGAFQKKGPEHLTDIRRVKEMVRARFRLDDDIAISVSELVCAQPGCPPLDTVVAFWTAPERRHHFRVFKAVADVVEDDLPPWWMKDALVVDEVFGCPCC